MTESIIYLCFSETAKGCLRNGIPPKSRQNIRVIALLDDLANGPIDKIEDLEKRLEWYKNLFLKDDVYVDMKEMMIKSHNDLKNEVLNIKDEDIYIWYGENGSELTGLLYVLSLLKDKVGQIYTINVSEKPYVSEDTKGYYRTVGEVTPQSMEWLLGMKKKLDLDNYSSLMNFWLRSQYKNTNLRVVKNKQLKSVHEDYFDDIILQNTNYYFSKCARTVRAVLGRSKNEVSDVYIVWRILELIKEGKIGYNGNLRNIKELEIRKVYDD